MERSKEGHPEQEPQLFYLAARFTLDEEEASKTTYDAVQQVLYTTLDCDLSAYRFLVPSQLTELRPRYVVVLGLEPSTKLVEQFRDILSQGEMTTIPDEALVELAERRLEQIQKGPWVEGHYKFGLKKKRGGQRRPHGKKRH